MIYNIMKTKIVYIFSLFRLSNHGNSDCLRILPLAAVGDDGGVQCYMYFGCFGVTTFCIFFSLFPVYLFINPIGKL